MPACPACGSEVAADAGQCPTCQLSVNLFEAIREAAGPAVDHDPAYLRTIGELLATVDFGKPTAPSAPETPHGLLSPPQRGATVLAPSAPRKRATKPIAPLTDLPQLPSGQTSADLERRVHEYFELGRRLGLDFTDFEARFGAATLSGDGSSLAVLAKEMFVHLVSNLAEEFESTLAERNEVTQLVPTPSADVELDAVRESIRVGDLAGALRRLTHVRDELVRLEQEWEVGRILVSECELLAQTIGELGGDPRPALGPLEEGRKHLQKGERAESETLLARAAVALWTVLEPRLFEELRRVRDRMVDARRAGADIAPGVGELRDVARELRQRNFVGMLMAYRRLRAFADSLSVPESTVPEPVADSPVVRNDPSA